MMKKLSSIIVASGLVLSACSTGNEEEENSKDQKQEKHMNHKSESKAPDNMKSTDDSKYKKDDKITITADHMPGMKNAKGTVKGAYKTYAYVVSYTPTNGDEKVNNHKRSEEHTSELQSRFDIVCRLLLEKKKITSKLMI